jgi:hypothetical protein
MAVHKVKLREGECAALIRLAVQRPVRFELGTGNLLWEDGQDEWPLEELIKMRTGRVVVSTDGEVGA